MSENCIFRMRRGGERAQLLTAHAALAHNLLNLQLQETQGPIWPSQSLHIGGTHKHTCRQNTQIHKTRATNPCYEHKKYYKTLGSHFWSLGFIFSIKKLRKSTPFNHMNTERKEVSRLKLFFEKELIFELCIIQISKENY